jgi:hypothetical protein
MHLNGHAAQQMREGNDPLWGRNNNAIHEAHLAHPSGKHCRDEDGMIGLLGKLIAAEFRDILFIHLLVFFVSNIVLPIAIPLRKIKW